MMIYLFAGLRAPTTKRHEAKPLRFQQGTYRPLTPFAGLRAPVVELADTLDLGSSAKAWGFESLQAHQT